jgi:alanine racemase
LHTAEPPDHIPACAEHGFHRVASSLDAVDYAGGQLNGSDKILRLHVNVETGMGRCGIEPELALQVIQRIRTYPNLKLAGLYTHFATADEEDLSYARQQLDRFNEFLSANPLPERSDLIIHSANSAATIKLPQAHFDMVRCGISMYGYYSRRMSNPPIPLEPVMKLEAPLVQIKTLPAGQSVSYGRSFITQRPTRVGMLPLGYADGYWRCFSNRALMKIGSLAVRVIGRVCMDQILIDVTDVPDAHVGQMVTVIDDRHDSPCGVYALAELADTICYEILTSVHAHVNRIVH